MHCSAAEKACRATSGLTFRSCPRTRPARWSRVCSGGSQAHDQRLTSSRRSGNWRGCPPDLDYPGGAIGDAYHASEWLDCERHTNSPERDAAAALENTLRTSEPVDMDPGLLQILSPTLI